MTIDGLSPSDGAMRHSDDLDGSTAVESVSSGAEFHVPPPATSRMKGGSANTKARTIKAITEAILIEKPRLSGGNNAESKADTGFLEYYFYRMLLFALFCLYAIFRFFQHQYNKIKLKIFSIVYDPSNTPQLIRQDVVKLNKIPKRLAVILEMKPVGDIGGGLKGILNDSSEIVCWTVSAGIGHLILYDFNGVIQSNVDELRNEIYLKLAKYFGPGNVPHFCVRIPHSNKVFYDRPGDTDPTNTENRRKHAIEISLLSNRDGRETIVDLTKTMADLCCNNELEVSDITMELIDNELVQLVGPEPDLLLYFGPSLDIQGFPPWHIRLTEFYWEEDNNQVSYAVFIGVLKSLLIVQLMWGSEEYRRTR